MGFQRDTSRPSPPDATTGGTPCVVLRLSYRCKYRYRKRGYRWCIFEANLSAQYICTRKIHLPHSLHTTNVCHDTPYTKHIRSCMPAHTRIHAHAHTHLILEKINKIGEKIRLCTGWSLELPLHALGCAVIEPAACLPACASSVAWSSATTRQNVTRSLTNRERLEQRGWEKERKKKRKELEGWEKTEYI